MKSENSRLLLSGVLFVVLIQGIASAANAYDVFTFTCEVGKLPKDTDGKLLWSWGRPTSSEKYEVTYHIDLLSKTYTSSRFKDPTKRYPIDSVRDDGSIRLNMEIDNDGYRIGGVTIHPEKGLYRLRNTYHNYQVVHVGTCKVIE